MKYWIVSTVTCSCYLWSQLKWSTEQWHGLLFTVNRKRVNNNGISCVDECCVLLRQATTDITFVRNAEYKEQMEPSETWHKSNVGYVFVSGWLLLCRLDPLSQTALLGLLGILLNDFSYNYFTCNSFFQLVYYIREPGSFQLYPNNHNT
jgi:hypothetical protein